MEVESKSDEYLSAAQLLINKKDNLHCSVVFCYYSVFLYMMFLLAHVKKDPILYSENGGIGDESVHQKVRENVLKRLNMVKQNDWNYLRTRILRLHELRVKADYNEKQFDLEEALDIYDETCMVRRKLKYCFNNLLDPSFK